MMLATQKIIDILDWKIPPLNSRRGFKLLLTFMKWKHLSFNESIKTAINLKYRMLADVKDHLYKLECITIKEENNEVSAI